MQIDLRTVSIKPLRNTFDHLARRFGDKRSVPTVFVSIIMNVRLVSVVPRRHFTNTFL